MTNNEISIVIGSWGSYNECNERALGSKWICLNDYEEWDDIIAELKNQGFNLNGIDEELFVQDIENFPTNAKNWDYVHPKDLFEVLKKSGVLDDASKFEKMEIFCDIEGYDEWERLVNDRDDFWDDNINLYPNFDWYDLGYYFLHEIDCIQIPDCLENYIDYKSYGEEFSFDGFHEYDGGIVEIRRYMARKQKTICKKLGWNILSDEKDIILSQYSPAGEDFSFYAEKGRFKDSIREYAEDFDPDEHAITWIENMRTVKGVPQSVRTLINDADAIKQMLTELSEQINKI